MTFSYHQIFFGNWEVLRSDGMLMAIFATEEGAAEYCLRKNSELAVTTIDEGN